MSSNPRSVKIPLKVVLEHYVATRSAAIPRHNPYANPRDPIQKAPHAIPKEKNIPNTHHKKLKTSQPTTDQGSNHTHIIAPINALPTTVLSGIFELILSTHPCHYENQDNGRDIPRMSPEILAQICSRWREVALHSRSLWRHIDIVLTKRCHYSQLLLHRATVFAARSDPLPLDIHVVGQSHFKDDDSPGLLDSTVMPFYGSILARAGSLRLPVHDPFLHLTLAILSDCFHKCKPGVMTQLITTGNSNGMNHAVPEGHGTDGGSFNWFDCMWGVKVVKLVGVFFPWNSPIYYGLVELRLVPFRSEDCFEINQSQLVGILSSCRSLRTLELGIGLDPTSQSEPGAPVILRHLEVLNLRFTFYKSYSRILRLISPGSEPLSLSLRFPVISLLRPIYEEAQPFFVRSNITKFLIEVRFKCHMDVLEVFDDLCLPNLQALSLAGLSMTSAPQRTSLGHGVHIQSTNDRNKPRSFPQCSQLSSLHLAICSFDLGYLWILSKSFPIRRVKLTSCSVPSQERASVDAKDYRGEIRKIVPLVEFGGLPRIWKDWNPWD